MSRAQKIILGCGIALVAIPTLALVFLLNIDWNRAKPWINREVSAATGRPFEIRGNLDLTWHATGVRAGDWRDYIPWPRLTARDVWLGNPDWSREPVMARAREISFPVGLWPLLEKKIVIPRLALDQPELTLERLHDGRANWLFEPRAENGWQLDLREIVLNEGKVHVMDGVKHADVRLDVTMLDDARRTDTYQLGWTAAGSFNGQQVSGTGKAGAVAAWRRQRGQYPIEAHLTVGRTAVDARGTVAEPRKLAALDLQLKLSGASMAHLYPLIGLAFPETPAFVAEGHFTGTPNRIGGDWSYDNFKGRIGNSDVSGSLKYQARRPRPLLEGSLVSSYLEFKDLRPLIGAAPPAGTENPNRKNSSRQPEKKLFPATVFRADRWRSMDADVQFAAKKIVRHRQLPIDHLVARIRMQNGVFSLAPLKFNIAGGSLVSNIRLDGTTRPVQGEVKLSARHVRLQQVFPASGGSQPSVGELNGDLALTGTGDSVAELMASANGNIQAVVSDGTISKLLLEQLGLNVSSIVATALFGDEQVKLNCAFSDVEIKKGMLRPRAAIVDTAEATLRIDGQVNLAQEKMALKVEPESKSWRLVSLRAPIYVSGALTKPQVTVDRDVVAMKAGSALALLAVAPVATALLPLVHMGPGENSQCGTLLAQANTTKTGAGRNALNASGQ
jgi:uncharacterized protein involved in outer membrane biogenesis